MSDKNTLIQELQLELYRLINLHIFSLGGFKMQKDNKPPDFFIAKSQLMDACLKLLNEFGESLSKDERLNKNENNS